MSDSSQDYYSELARQEALEHRDVLLSIASILNTDEGQKIFKYLFKYLDVGMVPPQGLKDEELHDYLGFLRAGNSIYKLACEADFKITGQLLSKLEREKYEQLCEQSRIEERGDA